MPGFRFIRPLFGVLGLLVLAGCAASVPSVDADIAAAARGADDSRVTDLLRQQGERIAGRPFLPGNRVDLLVDGPATYAAMRQAIEGARLRVDMESYEFDTAEGTRFADLLLAKRAEGLLVNLVYDSWGSKEAPAALFDRLRAGGVNVLEYNPLRLNRRVPVDINRRDHRKLLVVDGALAITGGVNITSVYDNRPAPPRTTDPEKLPWHDTDVRIEGPVVAQFEQMFMETWNEQHGRPLPQPPPTPGLIRGSAVVQAIDGAPSDGQPLIYRTLIVDISLARHSVHLTTGFFAPTPDLGRALEDAARRGVDVQVIVPAHSDSSLAVEAGRGSYSDLLDAGVGIHERQGAVLHAKTAVIDAVYSIVGSSNLDWRSVLWNNEIDAVIIDRAFAAKMEALFAADVGRSRRIDRAAWSRRPVGERLNEWSARLLEPLL